MTKKIELQEDGIPIMVMDVFHCHAPHEYILDPSKIYRIFVDGVEEMRLHGNIRLVVTPDVVSYYRITAKDTAVCEGAENSV